MMTAAGSMGAAAGCGWAAGARASATLAPVGGRSAMLPLFLCHRCFSATEDFAVPCAALQLHCVLAACICQLACFPERLGLRQFKGACQPRVSCHRRQGVDKDKRACMAKRAIYADCKLKIALIGRVERQIGALSQCMGLVRYRPGLGRQSRCVQGSVK